MTGTYLSIFAHVPLQNPPLIIITIISLQSAHPIQTASQQLRIPRVQAEAPVVRVVPPEGHPQAQLDAQALARPASDRCALPRTRMD